MDHETARQLRGSAELANDAIRVTVGAVADLHTQIAARVYAPLLLLGPLAAPAGMIMRLQATITDAVYQTILTANSVAGVGAAALLDQLDDGAKSHPGS